MLTEAPRSALWAFSPQFDGLDFHATGFFRRKDADMEDPIRFVQRKPHFPPVRRDGPIEADRLFRRKGLGFGSPRELAGAAGFRADAQCRGEGAVKIDARAGNERAGAASQACFGRNDQRPVLQGECAIAANPALDTVVRLGLPTGHRSVGS